MNFPIKPQVALVKNACVLNESGSTLTNADTPNQSVKVLSEATISEATISEALSEATLSDATISAAPIVNINKKLHDTHLGIRYVNYCIIVEI
jgi:hypothetical protein